MTNELPMQTPASKSRLQDPVDWMLSKFMINRCEPITMFSDTPRAQTICLAFPGEHLIDPKTKEEIAEATEAGFYILRPVYKNGEKEPSEHRWLYAGHVEDLNSIVNDALSELPDYEKHLQREGLRLCFMRLNERRRTPSQS